MGIASRLRRNENQLSLCAICSDFIALVAHLKAYYIKLGAGGEWEASCLCSGTLRIGYSSVPHNLCTEGRWIEARDVAFPAKMHSQSAATRHINQIRIFYEADEQTIFVTFANGSLYWCRSEQVVATLPDGSKQRRAIGGWSNRSVGGKLLSWDTLSGRLIKTAAFRGTICQIADADYLLLKIEDRPTKEAEAADAAEVAMLSVIESLMACLSWQDFEILIDLIFSSSGWRRLSSVGGTQKTLDLDLVLPTTNERAFVQVKSVISERELREYSDRFSASNPHDRMFLVWHTGRLPAQSTSNVILLGPDKLSKMILDAGLWSWLRAKTC